MKANELRIGSLVYITDTSTLLFYKQVTQINIHNLMYLCGETKDPFEFEIEPIPLTEEWLLKFGFEKTFITKIHLTFSKGTFSLLKRDKHIQIWYENINVQYVHQLQLLYFALTNEELR
jgi:hypothetical protein